MLSQAASQDIVTCTIAREDVRGKLASGVDRLHSLSRHLLAMVLRQQSSSPRDEVERSISAPLGRAVKKLTRRVRLPGLLRVPPRFRQK